MKMKRGRGWPAGAVVLCGALAGSAAAQGTQGTAAQGTAATMSTVAYGQGTSPTVQDDLFAGTEKFAKGASEVNEISMDPDSLDMVNGKDSKRAHNMVLNVVRSYEYDKPGMYRIEDVEEFRRKLNTGDWHCSVHTRELKSGESTDICNKRRTDGLVEQAIITMEPKELTFIHTIYKAGSRSSMDLPDVGGIVSGMGPELAMLGPTMAALRPQMMAEMAIARAEMRAQRDELGKSLYLDMPKLEMPKMPKMPPINIPQIGIPKVDIPQIDIPQIDTQAIDQELKELQQQQKNNEKDLLPQP